MANYRLIIPFTKAWEGGLSRATTDKASANPAPWLLNGIGGYHTNRGITFSTFQTWAPKFGYAVTPENFFQMPDDLWLKIFKGVYWDGLLLDQVRSEAVAAALSQWEWGSGDYGAGESLRKYLATKGITARTDQQQVDAINKLSFMNEEKIFRELIDWRAAFFKGLNQPANLQGWLNRLIYGSKGKVSMLQFGLSLLKKKS
jgi:lysozyme family protein